MRPGPVSEAAQEAERAVLRLMVLVCAPNEVPRPSQRRLAADLSALLQRLRDVDLELECLPASTSGGDQVLRRAAELRVALYTGQVQDTPVWEGPLDEALSAWWTPRQAPILDLVLALLRGGQWESRGGLFPQWRLQLAGKGAPSPEVQLLRHWARALPAGSRLVLEPTEAWTKAAESAGAELWEALYRLARGTEGVVVRDWAIKGAATDVLIRIPLPNREPTPEELLQLGDGMHTTLRGYK